MKHTQTIVFSLIALLFTGVVAYASWRYFDLAERHYRAAAIDGCSQYARASWHDDATAVDIAQPHQPGYEKCMKEKGLR
jgi:hypothetical protein